MHNVQQNMFVWRADASRDQSIALVDSSLEEFVPDTLLHDIPMSEPCCSQVAIWAGRPIPVFRSCPHLEPGNKDSTELANMMVLRVRSVPQTEFIGLTILGYPEKLKINDSFFEGFNIRKCGTWRHCLISGFVCEGRSVPIIDPDLLCSQDFIYAQNRRVQAGIYESY